MPVCATFAEERCFFMSISLYVEQSGPADTPTLVFLHGAATSGWMWRPVLEALTEYRILNVDLPGHGRSNHIEWISMDQTADLVADAIRAHASGQRAALIGLSLGGYVALAVMARHPACVERTIISGTTIMPLPFVPLLRLQVMVMSFFIHQDWFIRQQVKLLKIPDDSFQIYSESLRAMSRRTLVKISNEALVFRLPAALTTSPIPTLAVGGIREIPAVLDSIRHIQAAMPHAKGRVAANGHHGWVGENPELFTAMIRAWMTDAPLPEGLLTLE